MINKFYSYSIRISPKYILQTAKHLSNNQQEFKQSNKVHFNQAN